MPRNQELIHQLNDLKSLKTVTEALTEVSSAKVRGSRDSVLHARHYYDEISKVYYEIKLVYQEQLRIAKEAGKPIQERRKNGKRIGICITSSIKFTRELNEELVKYFIKETADINMERIVVGTLGQEILKEYRYEANYRVVKLNQDSYDQGIKELLDYVSQFSDIYFFHESFQTLLNQAPSLKHTSYDLVGERLGVVTPKFIFEPEITQVLQFFETEILRGLFQQSFYESDLSQYSQQLVTVENSTQKVEQLIRKQNKAIRKNQFMENNARQGNLFAGYYLWDTQ